MNKKEQLNFLNVFALSIVKQTQDVDDATIESMDLKELKRLSSLIKQIDDDFDDVLEAAKDQVALDQTPEVDFPPTIPFVRGDNHDSDDRRSTNP